MREILFRGKDTDTGEWVEGYYEFGYNCDEEPTHYIWVLNHSEKYGELFIVIPETVEQFTGLYAKNGKIFEGDIISSSWGYKGIVEFDEIMYAKLESLFNEDCEIIGNIHDNPEFLKEGEG